jgi:hypothetical protein
MEPAPASSSPRASQALGARAVTPAGSSAPSEDELSREVAVLDRARALMAAGDSKGAVRLVENQHLRILGPEAQALKIEALILNGDNSRAARLATQFLQSHPASPLARRVAELRDSAAPPSDVQSSKTEVSQP